MNVYSVDQAQADALIVNLVDIPQDSKDILSYYARNSQHIYAQFNQQELIGILGFIKPTLISDSAYAWFHHTPALAKCKIAFVRESRKALAMALKIYTSIEGVCNTDSGIAWLNFLGAQFTVITPGVYKFKLEN